MSTSELPLRSLGKDGPKVPALGFGLMELSYASYGTNPSEEDQFAILDRAVELGATFWDTSDLYGNSEELLGKWFKRTGKRDQIFLATKFGFVPGSRTFEADSSADYCKSACEDSLKRLGVDFIELYYMHMANPETPIEETMRALAELKAEGKIKHIGLSMVSSTTLRRAIKIAPVIAVQTEYSVVSQDIEGSAGTNLLATCRELGIAVVCATPLGRGLLTSTFSQGDAVGDEQDQRVRVMPRFLPANREQNVKAVNTFKELADKKGCSVSQLALAWLLKQGDDIIPIPGTKRQEYLEQNWEALSLSLTDGEEAEVRRSADTVQIAGGSLPDQFKSHVFRDTKEATK
ncbi:NADP-dependent oxidoreductase domain-containing protein [Aspergillus pseudoustus]|uniref:NADP-dependent oxidoreductase domain-containing protein n=1 Tax=Aspergillus pseudoustus TaxID=1810923 RepID=A0ABR4IY48_9EURO